MSVLAQFSASELELLASLPYKAGVFVSHADDEDGEADDEREMQALETCIQVIAKLHDDKPLTAQIMKQTLAMKMEWPRWAAQSFNAPQDCRLAVSLLSGKISDDEMKNYRRAIIEIATTVAQAYGEFSSFEEDEMEGGVFGVFVNKFVNTFSALSADDVNHPMNVSASEDNAIEQLKAALS